MPTGTRIPTWTFGERLAKAREDAGITQDEMADRFGRSHSTIAKWEGDKSQPNNLFDVVATWSEITDVSELWLLKGDDATNGAVTPRYGHLGADLLELPLWESPSARIPPSFTDVYQNVA